VAQAVKLGLDGLTVAAFESRRAEALASAIARHGGRPRLSPALREVPLTDNAETRAFAEKLFAGALDTLIVFTGTGVEALAQSLGTLKPRAEALAALKRLTLVARGPKPKAALEALGLPAAFTIPDPCTSDEILRWLDANLSLKDRRVAVLEAGVPNVDFLDALEARGAQVARAPLYRWALPEDTGPLKVLLQEITAGRAEVVLFTNANQVANIFQLAESMKTAEALRRALSGAVVAAMGPSTAARLSRFGVAADVAPAQPHLDELVETVALEAEALLGKKRASPVTASQPGSADPLRESLFMKACRREPTPRPPIWLMRQAGRYMKNYRRLRAKVPMLELCKHPDLSAEVTVDAVKQLDVDAAIIFSDLLLVVEPLGFSLEYAKGEGPLIRPAIRAASDVDRVKDVDVEKSLGFTLEALRKTRAALPPDVPLLGFAGAPFTLASYLIEGEGSRNYVRTKAFMHNEPKAWHRLMEKIARATTDFLNVQLASGAQAVQLFDSWVGCLSPADYKSHVLPHSRAVLKNVRGGPVIHFGTQTGALLELMKEAGGDVIGLDWRVNLADAWKRLGDVAVMGNFDPAILFSSPDEVRRQARRILDEAAGRPGFIFNLGHGILPETPMENVLALIGAVKGR